jgi:two-component system OmpR family response regulator
MNGADAVASSREGGPDLIVLDVMLPDFDGFEVIRQIRQERTRTPVVFLTARDATDDKVAGLMLGGDDYLTKPFSLAELTARIRAQLRRARIDSDERSLVTVADLEMDEEAHEVRRQGALISLTLTEFKLLRYLMLNVGRVLSKAQILDHVWPSGGYGDDSVESYIYYLRRKIDLNPPHLIHTVRGLGYVLRCPVDPPSGGR